MRTSQDQPSPAASFQTALFPCMTPRCRQDRIHLEYELSAAGPWILKDHTITCRACGQQYAVDLDADDSGATVRHRRL